jgi:hypothetical protein
MQPVIFADRHLKQSAYLTCLSLPCPHYLWITLWGVVRMNDSIHCLTKNIATMPFFVATALSGGRQKSPFCITQPMQANAQKKMTRCAQDQTR